MVGGNIMEFVLDLLIVVASLVVLYFAYVKKSELGKLSVYVIFASLLLQEFFQAVGSIQIFDFMRDVVSSLSMFVVYGEVVLLAVLLVSRWKKASNKYLKYSLIFLLVVKLVAVLGIF